MGLVDKPAFSAGELDPALWERTNLDKFRNGLATGRNWIISKTGSILTRPGRQYFATTKLQNRAVRLYSPPGSGILLEVGHQYIRTYSLTTWNLLIDNGLFPFLESDLPNLHFDTTGSYVYIFCAGKNLVKFNYATSFVIAQNQIFALPPAPAAVTLSSGGTPTGYNVQYLCTYTINGEESLGTIGAFTGSGNLYCPLPIVAGQTNAVIGQLCAQSSFANENPNVSAMNVYRRPWDGSNSVGSGAWGFVGSSTELSNATGFIFSSFTDVGAPADYTHQPPASIMAQDPNGAFNATLDPGKLLSNTGIIYQQRLVITDYVTDLQAIYASQPGFQDNFQQNFPLDDASALKFKCGTSGYARVLRMLDSDGLVAFTAAGIFLNQGQLGPNNIFMNKKGKWIINPVVPPLAIPGGVMFIDSMTNSVRNLMWSFYFNGFDAPEVTAYSSHLFRSRAFQTWNFQPGALPVLWVVFTDGTAATFTYDYNQQMQAWMRHDGAQPWESCAGTTNSDQSFFVVTKTDQNGNVNRYIEVTLPRYTPASYIASDPNYAMNASCAYMDGITSVEAKLNNALKGTDVFTFATTQFVDDPGPKKIPDWGGILNLDCGTSGIFANFSPIFGPPLPATAALRFFDEDGSAIDLNVLSYVDNNHLTVQVNNVDEFPSDWALGKAILYQTINALTGLFYLNGEYPAVIVDGAVLCSPNNDQENYPVLQVVNGLLILPAGVRGAIIHVGRPIVGDIETLEIDTVDQQPTLIESIVVNKLYLKVKDARGLYCGPRFPNGANGESTSGVTGMVAVDSLQVDYSQANPIIGNRAQPSYTTRYEVIPDGDWKQQGKICIRQVDPIHAEILSIIPDVEVEPRERS